MDPSRFSMSKASKMGRRARVGPPSAPLSPPALLAPLPPGMHPHSAVVQRRDATDRKSNRDGVPRASGNPVSNTPGPERIDFSQPGDSSSSRQFHGSEQTEDQRGTRRAQSAPVIDIGNEDEKLDAAATETVAVMDDALESLWEFSGLTKQVKKGMTSAKDLIRLQKSELQKTRDAIAELLTKLAGAREDMNSLQMELRKAEVRIIELEDSIESLTTERDSLKSHLDSLQERLTQNSEQNGESLRRKDEQIEQLQGKAAQQEREVKYTQKILEQELHARQKLQESLESNKATLHELQVEFRNREELWKKKEVEWDSKTAQWDSKTAEWKSKTAVWDSKTAEWHTKTVEWEETKETQINALNDLRRRLTVKEDAVQHLEDAIIKTYEHLLCSHDPLLTETNFELLRQHDEGAYKAILFEGDLQNHASARAFRDPKMGSSNGPSSSSDRLIGQYDTLLTTFVSYSSSQKRKLASLFLQAHARLNLFEEACSVLRRLVREGRVSAEEGLACVESGRIEVEELTGFISEAQQEFRRHEAFWMSRQNAWSCKNAELERKLEESEKALGKSNKTVETLTAAVEESKQVVNAKDDERQKLMAQTELQRDHAVRDGKVINERLLAERKGHAAEIQKFHASFLVKKREAEDITRRAHKQKESFEADKSEWEARKAKLEADKAKLEAQLREQTLTCEELLKRQRKVEESEKLVSSQLQSLQTSIAVKDAEMKRWNDAQNAEAKLEEIEYQTTLDRNKQRDASCEVKKMLPAGEQSSDVRRGEHATGARTRGALRQRVGSNSMRRDVPITAKEYGSLPRSSGRKATEGVRSSQDFGVQGGKVSKPERPSPMEAAQKRSRQKKRKTTVLQQHLGIPSQDNEGFTRNEPGYKEDDEDNDFLVEAFWE